MKKKETGHEAIIEDWSRWNSLPLCDRKDEVREGRRIGGGRRRERRKERGARKEKKGRRRKREKKEQEGGG